MPEVLKQLRPHQWVKNLLLFVPLSLAHHLGDVAALTSVLIGALCFSLAASAIYTINDIADIESDRQHPHKRDRPIAAGRISVRSGYLLSVLLLVVSAVVSWLLLPISFLALLIVYVSITTAYTFLFKKIVLLDVVVLAGLYVLRLVVGGVVANVLVSPWLLTFALFFFTSLAFLKRYTELRATVEREGRRISGRGYHVGDTDFILIAGTATGFLALLVFALYLQSAQVAMLYLHAERLWFIVPALLYWISRLWLKAHRGEMHEDAIVFAVRDGASYVVAGIVIVIVTMARLS